MLLGINKNFIAALFLLAAFGYLVSISSLLQYTIVQGHTPDHYLSRVNGLWTAQGASGDSIGTLGIGALGKIMSSLTSIVVLGAASLGLGLIMLVIFKCLRNAPMNNEQLDEFNTIENSNNKETSALITAK